MKEKKKEEEQNEKVEEMEENNQSVELTDVTQESLFKWNSNYNNELSSLRNTIEMQKMEEREGEEEIVQLKVSQYKEREENEVKVDREVANRLGTFKKQKEEVKKKVPKKSAKGEDEGKIWKRAKRRRGIQESRTGAEGPPQGKPS